MTTYTWLGSTPADWDTPGDWSPVGTPGASDSAIVANSGLLVEHDDSIGHLTVEAGFNLKINGGYLTVHGGIDNGGGATAGVIAVNFATGLGVLQFDGTQTVSNVTIVTSGFADNGATGASYPTLAALTGSVVTLAPSSQVRFAASDGNGIGFAGAGSFVNQTVITENGVITIGTTFTNAGSIVLNGELILDSRASFTNTGAIRAGLAEFFFGEALTTAQLGAVVAAPRSLFWFGGTLDNTGATFLVPTGVNIGGTIQGGTIEGALVLVHPYDLTLVGGPAFVGSGGAGRGEIDIDFSNTLDFKGTQTIDNLNVNVSITGDHATIDDIEPGIVTFASSTTFNLDMTDATAIILAENEFIFDGKTTIHLNGGSGYIDASESSASKFINNGSINLDGVGAIPFQLAGNVTNSGSISVANGATMEATGNFVDTGKIAGAGTFLLGRGTETLQLGAALSIANVTALQDAELVIAASVGYHGALIESLGATIAIASDDALALTGTSRIGGNVIGAGTLALAGGSANIIYGAELEQDHWSISGASTAVTLSEFLTYAGSFRQSGGATLTLAGVNNLTLTGSANFNDAIVNGSHRLFTDGTTRVADLTIGGTAVWGNLGNVTQTGGDVTIGDASGAAAILYNIAGATYDIADDSGIGRGASAASYFNNDSLVEKTGGGGTSAVAANVLNSSTIEAASGTLDFQAALWGTGVARVSGGATLEVDGAVGARQTVGFDGAGTLSLHDLEVGGSKLFHATISGFSAGDRLEFGAAFGAGTVAHFGEAPGHAFGHLTLTDGSLSAAIKLLGDYTTANFAPSLNAGGETVLTYHA